jgi:hypothetical protein
MLKKEYYMIIVKDFLNNYLDLYYIKKLNHLDKESIQSFILFDYFLSIFEMIEKKEMISPKNTSNDMNEMLDKLIEELGIENDNKDCEEREFFFSRSKYINSSVIEFISLSNDFLEYFIKIMIYYYENIKLQNDNIYHRDLLLFLVRLFSFKQEKYPNYLNFLLKYEHNFNFKTNFRIERMLSSNNFLSFFEFVEKKKNKTNFDKNYTVFFKFQNLAVNLVNHLYPSIREDVEFKHIHKFKRQEEMELSHPSMITFTDFLSKFVIYSDMNNGENLIQNELFLNNTNDEKEKLKQNLFLFIVKEFSFHQIKNFPYFLSIPLTEELVDYKLYPNKNIISALSNKYRKKAFELIDRLDFIKNYEDNQNNYQDNPKLKILEDQSVLNNKFNTEIHSSNYDPDYFLSKIKFNADTRFKEVLRILNPHRQIKVRFDGKFIENSHIENEKFNQLYKHILRQLSTCIGYGALNLNCIKSFPKDILPIKPLVNFL